MKFILIACTLLFSIATLGQGLVEGTIRDAKSKAPLPFVHVLDPASGSVTTSNIDGYFKLRSSKAIDSLSFSYVGYEILTTTPLASEDYFLSKKQVSLKPHEVFPGVNPAHRIIDLAYANSDNNNPEKASFEYDTYMKMKGRISLDSAMYSDTAQVDSSLMSMMEFMEISDLFLVETITHRKFRPPDHSKEVILGTKVSGLQNPDFGLITSQMGSFSFYDEVFVFGDQEYLNPISKNSTNRYLFILEDSTFNGQDTLFMISFRPRTGKQFNGLKGIMCVNSNGYAIQNLIAEPNDYQPGIKLKIQQAYELVDNRKWFPSEINTDFTVSIDTNGNQLAMEGKLKGYFLNIVLDPVLKKKEFNHVAIEVDPMATKQPDLFWDTMRVAPLTIREQTTYQKVDSISKEFKIERRLFILNSLLSGVIPVSFVDIDLNRLFRYNRYEGIGVGLGLHTNDRFSKHLKVGGYFNYGFGDQTWKYGGDLAIHPIKDQELALRFSYIDDVVEIGATEWYIQTRKGFSSASLRPVFVNKKDERTRAQAAIQFRAFNNLQTFVFANYDQRTTTDFYRYQVDGEEVESNFSTAEVGVQFRLALKEKFLPVNGKLFSLGTKSPIINLKYTRGIRGVGASAFDYNRVDLRIIHQYNWRTWGKTQVALSAGYNDGDLPRSLLFNAPSSYFHQLPLEAGQSFQTMRANEFFSDSYTNFFFKHSFLNIKTGSTWFKPMPVLYHNMGIGLLSSQNEGINPSLVSYQDGYLESGFGFDHLYSTSGVGIGFNVMYRYGPEALPYYLDNWAVKLTATANLNFGATLNLE